MQPDRRCPELLLVCGKVSETRHVQRNNADAAGAFTASEKSAALFRGFDAATGEFILFVDSDDWIDPAYCERYVTPLSSIVLTDYNRALHLSVIFVISLAVFTSITSSK